MQIVSLYYIIYSTCYYLPYSDAASNYISSSVYAMHSVGGKELHKRSVYYCIMSQ